MEIVGYEHLHLHTDFSLLDGFGQCEEYSAHWKNYGDYLCITDHGMMAAIPRQIKACEASGKKNDPHKDKKLFPLYGCELYVNPLQCEYDTEAALQSYIKSLDPDNLKIMRRRGYHLLAIAYNSTGYSNLVRLTSLAWTKGFYYRPRVNHEQLVKYKEGIIFTSCCYSSEVGQAFDVGGEDAGNAMIEKYLSMFGKENFYLEIMLLDYVKQKPYDAFIIKAADRYGLELICTNDCHYCKAEDSKYQRLMLMVQTQNTLQDIQRKMAEDGLQDFFELQDSNLWMKTEEELNVKWEKDYKDVIDYDLFKRSKANTVEVCRRAKGVELDRSVKLPQIPDADLKLKEFVTAGFKRRGLPMSRKYLDRVKEELGLICHKEFSSYFLIQKQMTDEARRICRELLGWGDGSEAVGPGRGCLQKDVPIVLNDGTTKPIGDICCGDTVMTRDGTAQLVEAIHCYPCDEELLRICCYYGDNKGVSLTKDHKILAEKCKRPNNYNSWAQSTRLSRKSIEEPTGELVWVRADELEVGDWVFVPQLKVSGSEISSIDLSIYCDGVNLRHDDEFVYQEWKNPLTGHLNSKKIKRHIVLDDDWFVLLGVFTGDGWFTSGGRPNVGYCFHLDDRFGLALLKHKLNEIGAEYSVRKQYKNKKVIQVIINSMFIRKLFADLFDKYECTSQTKHIPEFIFGVSDPQKIAFLRGYHLSDGYEGYTNKFSTSSEVLSNQIRFLCWQLKIPASLAVKKRIDPRSGHEGIERSVKTPRTEGISLTGESKAYQFRVIDGGILLRVRKIEIVQGVKEVYDLQVANNNNYLTSSFLVHNSAAGSLVCYCLGITDVDPIKHDLLFSRFLSPARGGKSMRLRFSIDPLPDVIVG